MQTPTAWTTIDEAAARMGVSTRTLQRRIQSGALRSQRRDDGRTLVEVEACPTPVVAPELVERLERQAEDTNRVAALAAVSAEQTALAYRDRLQATEASLNDARSSARSWRVLAAAALCVSLAAVVAAGYLGGERAATGRQMSDMVERLAVAERATIGLQSALEGATGARQASDDRAEALLAEVVELRDQVDGLRRSSDTWRVPYLARD
jgi:excisionase family DNA binding protein